MDADRHIDLGNEDAHIELDITQFMANARKAERRMMELAAKEIAIAEQLANADRAIGEIDAMPSEEHTITITLDLATESHAAAIQRFKDELNRIMLGKKQRDREMWERDTRIRNHIEAPMYQRNVEMYDAFQGGKVTFAALGRQYGISPSRVRSIIKNERAFREFMAELGAGDD